MELRGIRGDQYFRPLISCIFVPKIYLMQHLFLKEEKGAHKMIVLICALRD